jgi:hypothetical protein
MAKPNHGSRVTQQTQPWITHDPTDPAATPSKLEEIARTKNLMRPQEMPANSAILQQRRNERDFNYPKTTTAMPTFPEPGNRNMQLLKTNQLKALAEKNWAITGSTMGHT